MKYSRFSPIKLFGTEHFMSLRFILLKITSMSLPHWQSFVCNSIMGFIFLFLSIAFRETFTILMNVLNIYRDRLQRTSFFFQRQKRVYCVQQTYQTSHKITDISVYINLLQSNYVAIS